MATELQPGFSPFVARHIGPDAAQRSRMLADMGLADLEALVAQVVPEGIRLAPEQAEQGLPVGCDEAQALAELQAIAADNAVTPVLLFEKLAPFAAKTAESPGREGGSAKAAPREGGGWGRKTVASTAKEYGIEIETALSKLKAKGIEARQGDNLRELSGKTGLTPLDIAAIIRD